MSGWLFLTALAAAMAGWAVSRRPAGTVLAEKTRPPGTELVEKLKRWGPLAAWEAEQARRQDAQLCLEAMPEFLDIVSLGLWAGLPFDASLDLYVSRSHTLLSERLDQARLAWSLGICSRAEALEALAENLDLAALRRFADAVSESLEFGVPLAATLERQSAAMRRDQRLQVEEEIERVPVKLLLPMGALVVPALLLAILGPLLAAAFLTMG